MPEVLSHNSTIPEVLWNFSRFNKGKNRLTLKQNPHFYKFRDIPSMAEGYHDRFTADPIAEDEDFQVQFKPEHARICVITDSDKPGRIFLETAQHRRAFGNVWRIPDNNAIIFKGASLTLPFPSFLTTFQTSVGSLKAKISFMKISKAHPICGISRSFHRRQHLRPLWLRRVPAAHQIPRHQLRPVPHQMIRFVIGENRFAGDSSWVKG